MAFSNAHYNTFEIKIKLKNGYNYIIINILCKNQVNICKKNLNKAAKRSSLRSLRVIQSSCAQHIFQKFIMMY